MSRKNVDVGFIWKVTDDVLRDAFKKNEIGDQMLPFVVLRRLDCILKPYNEKVRKTYSDFRDKVREDKLDPILRQAAGGLQFYNFSNHTLETLRQDPKNIQINFRSYLHGFNEEVQEILECFQFDKVIARLVKNRLLYELIDAMCNIDLSPEKLDNHDMGYVFEELIRISNEQSNETAGEHFTPRDVIRLMQTVVLTPDRVDLCRSGIIRTLYDPACGTGGMVNLAKNFILDELCADMDKKPTISTFGQELNEHAYAIAKSEALITGENAKNIRHGNSFTEDHFQDKKFHYMFANPPYGVTWKKDADFIKNESLNPAGRFFAGLPGTSDGQLLFLQHMISKMEREGSKIAVVTNGSPLFTGDAGSGLSEIRKWMITNDWLDCIIALPNDLFYNTGISTYIWILNNNKPEQRRGKVQLINAGAKETVVNGNGKAEEKWVFCKPEPKSLGNKRNKLYDEHISEVFDLYEKYEEGPHCKIFDNDHFGFYQLTVEQPSYKNGKPEKDRSGNLKPDTSKRDRENVPLSEDIEVYFENEVKPHVPDAWIDFDKIRIGYEINFTKYFYQYNEQRKSSEVKGEIAEKEAEITKLLSQLLA